MLTLIADVDDTICPSTKPISPAMASEIERIIRGGCSFAFISGSSFQHLSAQITPFLPVPHHFLAVSGTHYVKVDYRDGKAVFNEQYRLEFTFAERKEILDAFDSLIAKYDICSMTTKEDQLQDRGSQITLSSIGRNAPDEKKRTNDPDGSKRRVWLGFLKTCLGDKYSMRIGGRTSIDITPKGVDKAWGIHRFLEANGLKPSEALFFGDKMDPDGNDYPALQVVDCIRVRNPEHTLEILKCFRTSLKA